MTDILSMAGEWLPRLLGGLGLSLQITGISLAFGIPLGLALALAVSSRSAPLRWITVAFVEVGRGAPALVVLYLVYYGLPDVGMSLPSFAAACTALTWTTGAYTSEIIRAGLQAVPAGEIEASEALGMPRRDTLRFIMIPQGLRVALPALMGFSILIFQASSLTFQIAVPELLAQAYSIGSSTFRYLGVLVLAGVLYAAISIPTTWMSVMLERRMSRHLL